VADSDAGLGLAEEPLLLVGGYVPALLRGDRDACGFAPADVSDQLREHGDGAEVANDFDLQPAVADRSIERGPLLWDRDLLAYVLRHHELVVRDLGQQAKSRHVHQVDEHDGVRDDDAEERCAHGVGSLSAAMPESSRS
jgi:hypothetical protein